MARSIQLTQRELWGGIMGPFEAWLTLRGLRSLPARLALHAGNARAVANHLARIRGQAPLYPGHPSFSPVRPGPPAEERGLLRPDELHPRPGF
jgi:cystathionine beta-lyase/cystathionine gamma-synthase